MPAAEGFRTWVRFPPPPPTQPIRTALRALDELEDLKGGSDLVTRFPHLGCDRDQAHPSEYAPKHHHVSFGSCFRRRDVWRVSRLDASRFQECQLTEERRSLVAGVPDVGAHEGGDASDGVSCHVEHGDLRKGVRRVLEDVKGRLHAGLRERGGEHLGV
jgi:hypothetical protein